MQQQQQQQQRLTSYLCCMDRIVKRHCLCALTQVVAAVNKQLGELTARKAELAHELAAAKERWQSEEGVRIRQAPGRTR